MSDSALRLVRGALFCASAILLLSPARAQTVPPYAIDFEAANGVAPGNLNGQDNWSVLQGSATVTASASAVSGASLVLLAPGSPPSQITRAFGAMAAGNITYTDFFAQPNVAWTIGESTTFDVESSRVGLVRLDSNGQVLAWDGNGSGGGRWVVTGKSIALDGSGQAATWTRFTIRQNYTTRKWDLYVDTVLVAHDLGFRDETRAYLSLFKLTAAASADSAFDDFYAGAENPLFTDADNDGLDDAWETAHSLNPAADDREADQDADGLSNLEEFALGTKPESADSDADGLPDAWEVDHGSNPLVDDAAADPGEVGRTLLQSFQQNLSPWPAPTVAGGLRAWFRADKGITKDSANHISSWLDMSGRASRATQLADPDRQPLYVAAALNGNPAVQYDDSRKALVTAGLTDTLGGGNDATIIAVVKPEPQQNYAATIFYWDTDGNWNMGLTASYATNQFQMVWRDGEGNTRLSPAINTSVGTVQILTTVKDGTTARAFLNGTSQGTGEVPAGMNLLPARAGVGNSASPYYSFHGQIAEVLVYNRALTTAERESIEAALATKYINPDADGDGLPDTWEDQYLGTRGYGPGDDPYAAGRTLLESYQQNLSPLPAPVVAGGLRAWYRADAGVTQDGNGRVSQWADLSGHGFHVAQVNDPGRQPLAVAGAMNGNPVVQYDDSQKALVSPAPVDVADGAADATVVAVVKPESSAHYSGTIFCWGTDGNYNLGLSGSQGASNVYSLIWRDGDGNTRLSPALNAAAGHVQVLTAVKSGATASAYLDGSLQGSSDVPAVMSLLPSRLGVGNGASPYYSFHGQIAEVLVYNRALTTAERESIEAALMTKYISPDADADGLPDAWEDQYLGTRNFGAGDDPGSVGRTLLQSYQQSLSPWPAPAVTSGLRAWYRADVGVTKDGDNKVSQWTDVSGHGFHVVQVNDAGRQPLAVANAMNGNPVVQYDDSLKALVSPAPVDVADGASNATIIAVVKPDAAAHYGGTIFYWDTDGNYNFGLSGSQGAANAYSMIWRDGDGHARLSPALNAAAGSVQVLTTVKDGTAASGFINGALQGTAEVPATMNLQPSRLGVGNGAYPYYSFHGQIAEVLVYNRALTAAEREGIETALMAKYINPDADGDGLPDSWEDQYLGTRDYGATDDPGSVGRTLLQSYQQSLSPWPAPTVGGGLRAWYRADAGLTKDADNNVSQWADISGHGFHVMQVNDAGRQPLAVANAVNGKAAVQYDNSQKALLTPAPVDVAAGADDATIVAVVRPQGEPHYAGTIFYWDTDGNYNMGLSSANGASNQYSLIWRADDGSSRVSPSATVTAGDAQIITIRKSGTTAGAYVGGTLQAESEVPEGMDVHASRLAVGNSAYPYYAFHGQIAEVLVYNRALSDTEREAVEAALTTRYLTPPTNQPPSVTLTAPAAGTVDASTPIVLTATASDADGTVSKVEFFADDVKLGEATSAPYSYTWTGATPGSHVLTAKATDDAGDTTISAPVMITVGSSSSSFSLLSDFETAEGYEPGPLGFQQFWESYSDDTVVEAQAGAPSGENVLRVGVYTNVWGHVSPPITQGVLYYDFYAKFVIDGSGRGPSGHFGGAFFMMTPDESGTAVDVIAGASNSPVEPQATGAKVALDENNTSAWHRYTFRLDFAAQRWDLYLDRTRIATNVPLGAGGLEYFYTDNNSWWNYLWLDRVGITTDNPLITDVDHDGMDDEWEAAHGLNPALSEGAADPDGDGLTNLQEYLANTDPHNSDTDGDGMSDGWESTHQLDANSAGDATEDPDEDGLSNLAEYQAGSNPHDYYNGVMPIVTFVAGGDGQPGPGGLLQVRITDLSGTPFVNAAVSFSITSGTSELALTAEAEAARSTVATVRTGSDGQAAVYYRTPLGQTNLGTVKVQAGTVERTMTMRAPDPREGSGVTIDFESSEGYVPGPLGGQGVWATSSQDIAVTTQPDAPSGENVLSIPNSNSVSYPLAPPVEEGIIFLDFWAKLSGGRLYFGGLDLSFVRDSSGNALDLVVYTMSGDSSYETKIGGKIALDETGSSAWHRYTFRVNYGQHGMDFYLDGQMVAYGVDFGYNAVTGLSFENYGGGLDSLDKVQFTGGNPLFADADQDGMDDAWEATHGLNSAVNDRDGDLDHDGFSNLQEFIAGTDPQTISTGGIFDTDNNGLPDSWERSYFGEIGVNPSGDADGDGLSNLQEMRAGTNPTSTDSDGDGLSDGYEIAHGRNPLLAEGDLDGNGISDGWEFAHFGRTGIDPAADPDGDGLTNLQEMNAGTNPLNRDTDGDGLSDGQEAELGSNPNDPGSNGGTLVQWNADYTITGMQETQYIPGEGIMGFETVLGNPDSYVRYQAATYHMHRNSTGYDEVEAWTPVGDGTWRRVVDFAAIPQYDIPARHTEQIVRLSDMGHERNMIAEQYRNSPQEITGNATIVSDDGDLRFTYTLSQEVQPTIIQGGPYTNHYSEIGLPTVSQYPAHTTTAVYYLTVPQGLPGVIRWFEIFTPLDGSAKHYKQIEWTINGATQSPSYSLVCPAAGTTAVVPYTAQLAIDANHDGHIDGSESSGTGTTSTVPLSLLPNLDDNDQDSVVDSTDGKVNGAADLVNFSPVFLNLQQLVQTLPPADNVVYKLSQADSAVNLVYTNLTRDTALSFKTSTAPSGFGRGLDKPVASADTQQVTTGGIDIFGGTTGSPAFLDAVLNGNGGVVLLESRQASIQPLVLTIELDGQVVLQLDLALLPGNAELAVDANRDGQIKLFSENVPDGTSSTQPYRFWINDDDDEGDSTGGDISIEEGSVTGRNCDDFHINGRRDLVDWFPVFLDIKQLLTLYPPASVVGEVNGAKYKLKQADGAVNFVYTKLTRADALKYQTQNMGPVFGGGTTSIITLNSPIHEAKVDHVVAEGTDLFAHSPAFYDAIWNNDGGVLLIEGCGPTIQPLVLSIEKADGTVITVLKIDLAIGQVESMYRHLNLREGSDAPAGLLGRTADAHTAVATAMDEPAGFPDEPGNAKWLVFIHGFNVSGQKARGWNAETFKRLYWSGGKARFVGVSWFGNPGPGDSDHIQDYANIVQGYHWAVRNALPTAEALAQKINALPGSKVVMGHSQGCWVASVAVSDYNMSVNKALLIDAAFARECLDGAASMDALNMVPSAWTDYPTWSWAANWFQRFEIDGQPSADNRSTLTWRDRLVPLLSKTVVYSFYSSTEDVLEKYPGTPTSAVLENAFYAITDLNTSEMGRYAWISQEKTKGDKAFFTQGSAYGGWGFNLNDGLSPSHPKWYVPLPSQQARRVKTPGEIGTADSALLEGVKFNPLFKSGWGRYDPLNPALEFVDTSGLSQVGPEWILDLYDDSLGSSVAGVHQKQLLAEAIPAVSLPVGANFTNAVGDLNFDMPARFASSDWPRGNKDGTNTPDWHHSDIREIAYVYMSGFFKKVADESK